MASAQQRSAAGDSDTSFEQEQAASNQLQLQNDNLAQAFKKLPTKDLLALCEDAGLPIGGGKPNKDELALRLVGSVNIMDFDEKSDSFAALTLSELFAVAVKIQLVNPTVNRLDLMRRILAWRMDRAEPPDDAAEWLQEQGFNSSGTPEQCMARWKLFADGNFPRAFESMDRATLVLYADLFNLLPDEPTDRNSLEQALVSYRDAPVAKASLPLNSGEEGRGEDDPDGDSVKLDYTDAQGKKHRAIVPSSLATLLVENNNTVSRLQKSSTKSERETATLKAQIADLQQKCSALLAQGALQQHPPPPPPAPTKADKALAGILRSITDEQALLSPAKIGAVKPLLASASAAVLTCFHGDPSFDSATRSFTGTPNWRSVSANLAALAGAPVPMQQPSAMVLPAAIGSSAPAPQAPASETVTLINALKAAIGAGKSNSKKRKQASKSDDDDDGTQDDDDDDEPRGDSRAVLKKTPPCDVVFTYDDNPKRFAYAIARALSVKFSASFTRLLKDDNKRIMMSFDGGELEFMQAMLKFSSHITSLLKTAGDAEAKQGIPNAPAKRLAQVAAFLEIFPVMQQHLEDMGELYQVGASLNRAYIKDFVCTSLGLSMDVFIHTNMKKTLDATASIKRQFSQKPEQQPRQPGQQQPQRVQQPPPPWAGFQPSFAPPHQIQPQQNTMYNRPPPPPPGMPPPGQQQGGGQHQRPNARQVGVHFPNAKMLLNGASRTHDKRNPCNTCNAMHDFFECPVGFLDKVGKQMPGWHVTVRDPSNIKSWTYEKNQSHWSGDTINDACKQAWRDLQAQGICTFSADTKAGPAPAPPI